MTELEKLLAYYGHDHSQKCLEITSLVNVITCKHEDLSFKLEATSGWGIRHVETYEA